MGQSGPKGAGVKACSKVMVRRQAVPAGSARSQIRPKFQMSPRTLNKTFTRKDKALANILTKTWRALKLEGDGVRRKTHLQNSGSSRKTVSDDELGVETAPICSAAGGLLWTLDGPPKG